MVCDLDAAPLFQKAEKLIAEVLLLLCCAEVEGHVDGGALGSHVEGCFVGSGRNLSSMEKYRL